MIKRVYRFSLDDFFVKLISVSTNESVNKIEPKKHAERNGLAGLDWQTVIIAFGSG